MGWESDTYTLSRHGWDMATNNGYLNDTLEVILHNRQLGVVAGGELHGYRDLAHSLHDRSRYVGDMLKHAVINMRYLQHKNHLVVRSTEEPFVNMSWVDMRPSHTFVSREYRVDEIGLFKQLATPVEQELIVDPECVQSMLDQILKLQGPMRKEIRARDQCRDRDEPQTRQVHAQIISLRQAA